MKFHILAFLAASIIAAPTDLDLSTKKTTYSVCSASNAILQLSNVNFSPNPISSGDEITMTLTGTTVSGVISKGASIKASIKFGFLTVFSQVLDFCTEASAQNLACPIAAGTHVNWVSKFSIPKAAPGGSYKATFSFTNANGAEFACVGANIEL